jgi:hypothetical protein
MLAVLKPDFRRMPGSLNFSSENPDLRPRQFFLRPKEFALKSKNNAPTRRNPA